MNCQHCEIFDAEFKIVVNGLMKVYYLNQNISFNHQSYVKYLCFGWYQRVCWLFNEDDEHIERYNSNDVSHPII